MLASVPAILRKNGFRVQVFTDDHPPAHVHVAFGDSRMRFVLGEGHVKLDKVKGRPKRSELRRAAKIVAECLESCWKAWEKYHG